MSAVSAESPRSGADLTEAEHNHSSERDAPDHPADDLPAGKDFGPNEWLVDELYQRYLADPGSVDMAWWNFFADYQPPKGSARGEGAGGVLSSARPAVAPAQASRAAGSTSRGAAGRGGANELTRGRPAAWP